MPRHKTCFDLVEMKKHLKELTPEERQECKKFEQLRSIVNRQPKEMGMSEFDKVIEAIQRRKILVRNKTILTQFLEKIL